MTLCFVVCVILSFAQLSRAVFQKKKGISLQLRLSNAPDLILSIQAKPISCYTQSRRKWSERR